MSAKRRYGWLLAILRYGLLAVALVYLYRNVPWHDYVTLTHATPARVPLLSETRDPASGQLLSVTVLRAGAETRVDGAEVQLDEKTGIPNIQYGLRTTVARIDWRLAVVSLLMFVPVPFLMAWRLVWMLAAQGVALGLWPSIKLTFTGNFYNFALPGTTGGDVIKAFYLTQHTHHKTEAVTTVGLDRVMGMTGNVTLASAMFVVALCVGERGLGKFAVIPILVGGGLIGGAIVVLVPRLRRMVRWLAERMPAGAHFVRAGRAVVKLSRQPGRVVFALLLTFLLQALVYVSAYVMARAMGMDGAVLRYMVFVPIGFMVAAIPIGPPQGFGVMEWCFVQFFVGAGMHNSMSQAVTLALAVRLTQVVWSLPGALVPLLGAHLPKAQELAEFEASEGDAPPAEATAGQVFGPPAAATPRANP